MSHNFNPRHNILIYCDGACSGNPGPGGWGAIVADPNGTVIELGGADRSTTNNQMELIAAIEALKCCKKNGTNNYSIFVATDSVYVIRGITQWIWGWKKRLWKTAEGEAVANQELWEELLKLQTHFKKDGGISWNYVRGHTGVPGNERCDEIAVNFSKGRFDPLYRGPLIKYEHALFDLPENMEVPEMKPKQTKVAAFSYLSLVNGKVERHSTWAECESRVKGRSGAKFKKATSKEDELDILKQWGIKPDSID